MSQDERTRLVRVHVVAEVTGLSCGMITRLADAGTIPHLRPNPRGNRYYALPTVLRALGLAEPTVRYDDVVRLLSVGRPESATHRTRICRNHEDTHLGHVLDQEETDIGGAMTKSMRQLIEKKRELERRTPYPGNSRVEAINEPKRRMILRSSSRSK